MRIWVVLAATWMAATRAIILPLKVTATLSQKSSSHLQQIMTMFLLPYIPYPSIQKMQRGLWMFFPKSITVVQLPLA